MKSYCRRSLILFIVGLVLSLGVVAEEQKSREAQHEDATARLITMVEHDADLKTMLKESIASAKKINGDRQTNPAQSLEEYYRFIDWAAKAMPWSILPDLPYPKLYEKIDQSLDYFYFINDQPLAELKGRGYYNNSLQYHEPYRSWLIEFTKNWGLYLSEEGSWNEEYYKMALADERFGLQKDWYEAPSRWHTFNQFFARYLKSTDVRPIASPGDPSVVVSPADSKPQGVWKIDGKSNIRGAGGAGARIKSNVFTSASVLIGRNSKYKNAFANGTLTHTFLDVNDYHRYHFPIGGTVLEVTLIEADDAAGGLTLWDTDKYILKATKPGWQNIETRGCVIVDTKEYGLVAVLPIGMSQVSSVNFEAAVQPGMTLKKGDMLGSFLFGGSDIVMLFQKKVDFKLTVPPDPSHPGAYKHLLMGEEYGRISKRK